MTKYTIFALFLASGVFAAAGGEAENPESFRQKLMTSQEAARQLFQLVLETASGKETKAEQHGYREIAIFKSGVTL